MSNHRANLLATAWGIAEATVFFIVPDVLLSWLALRNRRLALVACLFALLGALIGGTAVWIIGQDNPEPVRNLFAALPAIDTAMIASVRSQLEQNGLAALFVGPLIGTPYKIYALEAANLGLGFIGFLLVSIPARLIRFGVVTLIVATLSTLLGPRLSLRQRQYLLVSCWAVFYAWYFHVIGNTPTPA